MPTYECDNCIYSTEIKTHFNRHLKTKKHINKLKAISDKILKMSTNEHKMSTNIKCDYCVNQFATMANKRRHELHYCKKNKDTLKVIELETKYKDEFEKMHKQIEMLMDEKQKCSNINTNNTNNNTNNNTFNIDKQIILNNYGNEDMSHITNNFKDSLLNIPFSAISKMIEKVHFNKKKTTK